MVLLDIKWSELNALKFPLIRLLDMPDGVIQAEGGVASSWLLLGNVCSRVRE